MSIWLGTVRDQQRDNSNCRVMSPTSANVSRQANARSFIAPLATCSNKTLAQRRGVTTFQAEWASMLDPQAALKTLSFNRFWQEILLSNFGDFCHF
jgi:hypothetical protein